MSRKKTAIYVLLLAIVTIAFLPCLYAQKERQAFAEPNDMLAVFLGEEKSKTFPTKDSGYVYDHTECTNDEEATWDDATWKLTVGNITKSTKCNVFFVPEFQEQTYAYTGTVQTFTAPYTGNFLLEVWGAQGGTGNANGSKGPHTGGKGGYAKGTIYLEAGKQLFIYVGGKGADTGTSPLTGGWNGGGNHLFASSTRDCTSGGGATDIALHGTEDSTEWNNENHLYSRLIVAGGGGGASYYDGQGAGGAGGGENGQKVNNGGAGATQIAGGAANGQQSFAGSFGIGGNSGGANSGGGAGGGGWYGGAGGINGAGPANGGGGGGSGWIYTETSFNTWKAGNTSDAAKWKADTKYYLKDAEMIAGSGSIPMHEATENDANGYAKISAVR